MWLGNPALNPAVPTVVPALRVTFVLLALRDLFRLQARPASAAIPAWQLPCLRSISQWLR
jgi:hypothetical protein